MEDAEVILNLINKGVENELVDFKQDYYSKEKRAYLIKDICAFANGESNEDKFIIFGVSDQNCDICGISNDLEDISCINQLLEENVEPFIHISTGMFKHMGKSIGYIKIYNNNNRPYVLKREYGKEEKLKKGDIYIRKGATIFRALRIDLDFMYSKRYRKQVSLNDNCLFIGPVNSKETPSFEAGKIQVEFINESDMSITFKWGYVTIENQFGKVDRMILNNDNGKVRRLDDKPYELGAKTQRVEDFLFEFSSNDCLRLNFDENGKMCYPTKAKVTFIDLEENEYSCAFTEIDLFARGNILHKIKRKFQNFRLFLKKEEKNLMHCIVQDDKEKLCEILDKGDSYFELIQPPYCLANTDFPEFHSTYDLIKKALLKDEKIVNLFWQHGLSVDFIDLCRADWIYSLS